MRPFIIILMLAVAFAVGVCPCGLALTLTTATHDLLPSQIASAEREHASPCCSTKGEAQSHPANQPADPEACAATVSGDLPAEPTVTPAIVAIPCIIELPIDSLRRPRLFTFLSERRHTGLPPPPTLLNLSCSLTT